MLAQERRLIGHTAGLLDCLGAAAPPVSVRGCQMAYGLCVSVWRPAPAITPRLSTLPPPLTGALSAAD